MDFDPLLHDFRHHVHVEGRSLQTFQSTAMSFFLFSLCEWPALRQLDCHSSTSLTAPESHRESCSEGSKLFFQCLFALVIPEGDLAVKRIWKGIVLVSGSTPTSTRFHWHSRFERQRM